MLAQLLFARPPPRFSRMSRQSPSLPTQNQLSSLRRRRLWRPILRVLLELELPSEPPLGRKHEGGKDEPQHLPLEAAHSPCKSPNPVKFLGLVRCHASHLLFPFYFKSSV